MNDGRGYGQHIQGPDNRPVYRIKADSYDHSFDQDASFDDRDYSIEERRASYRGREDDSYEDRFEMAEDDKFRRNYEPDVEEDSRYGDGYRPEKEFLRYDSYDLPEEKYSTVSKREPEDVYVREEDHRRDLYEEGDRQIKGRADGGTFNGYSFEEDQVPYDSFEKTEGSFDDYDKDTRGYPANSLTKDSGYQTCDRRGSDETHYDQKVQSSSPGIGMMVTKEGSIERPGSQQRKGSSLSVQQSQERRPSGGGLYDPSYERKPSSATIEIYDQLHSRKSSASGLYEPLVDRTQSSSSPFEQKSMSLESRSNDSPAQLQKMLADQQPARDVSPIQELAFGGAAHRPSAADAIQDKESESLLGYLLRLWPIDIVLVRLSFALRRQPLIVSSWMSFGFYPCFISFE